MQNAAWNEFFRSKGKASHQIYGKVKALCTGRRISLLGSPGGSNPEMSFQVGISWRDPFPLQYVKILQNTTQNCNLACKGGTTPESSAQMR